MEGVTKINACAFFIKDEEGTIQEAGIVLFKNLRASVGVELRTFKKDARQEMVRTLPPGGTSIIDKTSGGRIELIASDMDDSIPFSAILSTIDVLREKFDIPIIKVSKTKTIAVKPNPARS